MLKEKLPNSDDWSEDKSLNPYFNGTCSKRSKSKESYITEYKS